MCEIVIVIPDLYLDPGPENPGALGSMPGFEHAARYGTRRSIASDGGWRPWLARWLGRPDLASHAPASIAAALLPQVPGARRTVWLATPVHLVAGLTNLHFDRRGILLLSSQDRAGFAADFNRTFGDTDLHLEPLANGDFLLRAPAAWSAATREPARALIGDLQSAVPKGDAAGALKRLGAEIEMWLHTHPINAARQRRGERPVSTLWLWGGGALESLRSSSVPPTDLACGTDSYLAGLWHLQGAAPRALPDRFGDLLSDPKLDRAALVAAITPLLQTNPNWTVFEALVDLDRRYLTPALAALHTRSLQGLALIANDVEARVRPGDRLKFWRRSRPGNLFVL